jgi:regulator of PEP synthase PpsR (kinase-PPPase family)
MLLSSPTIFILSGGIGSSGEQLVNTVLAQFPGASVKLVMVGSIRQPEQILATLAQARVAGGMVVHTLVETPLRSLLAQEAQRMGVTAVDLMGPLIQWLAQALGREPLGKPGLYRQLNRQYFERVAAIDFTMAHDDGKNPEGWEQAEFVLVGVSRVGKTPLSLYLAVLGWKVAKRCSS